VHARSRLPITTDIGYKFNERSVRNNFFMLAGAAVIVAAVLYVSVIRDAALCYKVPACPQIRGVIFGY
jgi:hypothetical protein